MCELLALNANVPTDICFSFAGLMQRGGRTGPHTDGWGIAMYEGRRARAFHDPRPSVASEIAQFIRRHAIRSTLIVSHIRKANRGRVCLANTHPFERELWGASWVFAHNGQLRGVKRLPLGAYRPMGTTDSEHAFCWLLDRIRRRFRTRPATPRLARFVGHLAAELDQHGTFNFLMADGRALYAWCSTRLCWITRRHPFGVARSIDTGEVMDFSAVTTPSDVVTIVASRPLTDNETWFAMERGALEVFVDGEPQLGAAVRPIPAAAAA